MKKNNLVSTHVGLSGLMKKPSNKPVIKSNIADGKNVRKGENRCDKTMLGGRCPGNQSDCERFLWTSGIKTEA